MLHVARVNLKRVCARLRRAMATPGVFLLALRLRPPDVALRAHPGYVSFTFFNGNCRTGLPVAAWMAFSTAGVTTQMVGSPTPPQKS